MDTIYLNVLLLWIRMHQIPSKGLELQIMQILYVNNIIR